MKEFMNMISRMVKNNQKELLERLKKDSGSCWYFWGAGNEYNDALLGYLKDLGINITAVAVVDEIKNADFEGIKQIALSEIADCDERPEYVMALHDESCLALTEFFRNLGIKTMVVNNMFTRNYEMYIDNLSNLAEAYFSLADDVSKHIFLHDISGDVTGIYNYYEYAAEPQYMLNGFLPEKDDIAVDGGCYDGAVARDFAALGAKVFAFEMDGDNYRRCREQAEKYGFTAENMGLYSMKQVKSYSAGAAGSRMNDNGNTEAQFISIDQYICERDIPQVDYIKLDVEGAELETLKGAAGAIARFKPRMAISSYHKPEDMWTLLQYIKSLRPDYEFSWRHYRIDSASYWLDDDMKLLRHRFGLGDLVETPWEKVLYCR